MNCDLRYFGNFITETAEHECPRSPVLRYCLYYDRPSTIY